MHKQALGLPLHTIIDMFHMGVNPTGTVDMDRHPLKWPLNYCAQAYAA